MKFNTLELNYRTDLKAMYVYLNRPKALNAMSLELFEELLKAFEYIHQNISVLDIRVVVLQGRGKHFCAGLDLKEAMKLMTIEGPELDQARKSRIMIEKLTNMQRAMTVLNDCIVPVIAFTQGYTIGGALDLITAADIRLCAADCQFSIAEITIGMAPDMGTIQRITKITGNQSTVRKLLYTGQMFNAQLAKEIGLVSDITDESGVEKLVKEISEKTPVGIYAIKQALRFQNLDNLKELEYMGKLNGSQLFTKDVEIAVVAKLGKQKPEFPKL